MGRGGGRGRANVSPTRWRSRPLTRTVGLPCALSSSVGRRSRTGVLHRRAVLARHEGSPDLQAVSAALYWPSLHRQVRCDGPAKPVSDAEADRYWTTRPRGARVAATISRQSMEVPSRTALEAAVRRGPDGVAGAGAAPGTVGVPDRAGEHRVLAGATEPAPRSDSLRSIRRHLAAESPRPVGPKCRVAIRRCDLITINRAGLPSMVMSGTFGTCSRLPAPPIWKHS